MRCRPTKLIYANHRLPPWLNEDATRDRSNRLLDDATRPPDRRIHRISLVPQKTGSALHRNPKRETGP
jgi:hypothetical protein